MLNPMLTDPLPLSTLSSYAQLAELDYAPGDQLSPEVLALSGPTQPEEVPYMPERKASTSSNRTMSPVAAKPAPPLVSPKVCCHCGFWVQ